MSHWERQPWEKPRMECSEGPGYAPVAPKPISRVAVTICLIAVMCAAYFAGWRS